MSRTNKQTKAKNCFGQKNRNFVIILNMSQLKSEPSDKCRKRLPRKTMFYIISPKAF